MKLFVKILIGIFIFVSIPIISWGTADIISFFDNPVRLLYSILIILIQIILVIKFPQIGSNRGKGKNTVKRQHAAIFFLQIIPILILILSAYSDSHKIATISENEIFRYLGLALFLSGFILMNWAEIILGNQFSVEVTIQENHQLIISGPYKYLRHPRYLGIILFAIGISFIFNSWSSLILVLLLIIVLLLRIKDEEELMNNQFGDEWLQYKNKSRRIIPFIY